MNEEKNTLSAISFMFHLLVSLPWISKWLLSALWVFIFIFLYIISCKIPESRFHRSECPESAQFDPFSHKESFSREKWGLMSPLVMADSLLLWALSEPRCFPSVWAVVLIGDQLSYYCEFIQHIMCCKMPHIQFISHFLSKSLTREGGEFRRI